MALQENEKERWTIDPSRFIKQIEIAQTLQGRILRGYDQETNKYVAIKETIKELIFKGKSINGHNIKEDYLKERKLFIHLNNYNNINIIGLIGIWEDDDNYYMAMEYADECLFDFTVKYTKHIGQVNVNENQINIWINQVRDIFFQIVRAVSSMHECGVCHLDLSLENALISLINFNGKSINIIKIIDFGVAQQFFNNNFQCNKFRIGKEEYMAPEVRHQGNKLNYNAIKADIYSMGIMLFMLLIGAPPYKTVDDAAARYIIGGKIREVLNHWQRIKYVNDEVLDLLTKILCPSEKRISMDEIKKHPFVNYDQLLDKFEDLIKPLSPLVKQSSIKDSQDPPNLNIEDDEDHGIQYVKSISHDDINNEIKQDDEDLLIKSTIINNNNQRTKGIERQTSDQSSISLTSCTDNTSLNNSFMSNRSSNTPISSSKPHYSLYDNNSNQVHNNIINEEQSVKGLDEDDDFVQNNPDGQDVADEFRAPSNVDNNNEDLLGFLQENNISSKSKSKENNNNKNQKVTSENKKSNIQSQIL